MDSHTTNDGISRRKFLKRTAIVTLTAGLTPLPTAVGKLMAQDTQPMKTRPIPSSGESIPVVGVGTWQQFDVSPDPAYLEPLQQVLKNLFQTGGSLIDTSPMYGNAETVLGNLFASMGNRDRAFLATKVWTSGKQSGIDQMKRSMDKMNASKVDLMQIHNLVDWKTHLTTLKEWKSRGTLRYTGITHYTESAFDDLETIMKSREIDFVQLPYSIGFRAAENRLLPLAQDQGIAVIVNRPFEAGSLFRGIQNQPLPPWKNEIDCSSWAQFFLKYILGHPAVTCVIPGTSDPQHMLENARAGTGNIPGEKLRNRMHEYWKSL